MRHLRRSTKQLIRLGLVLVLGCFACTIGLAIVLGDFHVVNFTEAEANKKREMEATAQLKIDHTLKERR